MLWLQVTAVCRRWRQVAISNPLLWNTIALKCVIEEPAEPEFELLWFQRAAGALLDVHIWDYSRIHPRLLEAITLRAGQLRRLDIHRAWDLDESYLFTLPMPRLETLSLSYDLHNRLRGMRDRPHVHRLSATFLNSAPLLKRLFVHGVNIFHFAATIVGNLSHVIIDRQVLLVPDDLESLLHVNSRVETLALLGCGTDFRGRSFARSQRAERLQSLNRIALKNCDHFLVREVLDRIEPPVSGLTMDFRPCQLDFDHLDVVQTLSPEVYPHMMPLLDIRALTVDGYARLELLAVGSGNSAIRIVVTPDTGVSSLHTFASVFALRGLLELHIKAEPLLDGREDLDAFYLHLRSLTKLVLYNVRHVWVEGIARLDSGTGGATNDVHDLVPLPSLHTLVLVLMPSQKNLSADAFCQALTRAVAQRHDVGARLRLLLVMYGTDYTSSHDPLLAWLRSERQTLEAHVHEMRFEPLAAGGYPTPFMPPASRAWFEEQREADALIASKREEENEF